MLGVMRGFMTLVSLNNQQNYSEVRKLVTFKNKKDQQTIHKIMFSKKLKTLVYDSRINCKYERF